MRGVKVKDGTKTNKIKMIISHIYLPGVSFMYGRTGLSTKEPKPSLNLRVRLLIVLAE